MLAAMALQSRSDLTACALHAGQAMQLSEGQMEAIRTAAFSPVCILTGGPGCGKTTTTKYVVDLWAAMGKKLAICAPTGRFCPLCQLGIM